MNHIRENVKKFVAHRDRLGRKNPHVYVKSILSPRVEVNDEFLKFFSDIGDERVFEGLQNWNDDSNRYATDMGVTVGELNTSEYYQHKKYVCP